MSRKNTDYFARITAILSLVIAITAVLVPFFQQETAQEIQKNQFETLQKEDLAVQLNPYIDGNIKLTNIKLGPIGYVVQIPWKLTISNNGNRKLSITEHLITRGESPESMQYSGIDGGFFNSDYQPIKHPIILEPGESKILYVYLGITVSQSIFEYLTSSKNKLNLTDREVTKILGRKGIDIYGNSVEYKEFGDHSFHITVKERDKAQRFWIQLITGRGNVFIASAKKYEPLR